MGESLAYRLVGTIVGLSAKYSYKSFPGRFDGAPLLQAKQSLTFTHVGLGAIPPEGRGIEEKAFESLS